MAKRNKKNRSVSEIAIWIISILVVLSMAVGFVLSVLPQPEPPAPEPTFIISTVEPDVMEMIIEGENTETSPGPVPNPLPAAE